ncbi:MAG: alpha/beta fold hydrolase [Methyloceanibacter sp.]
MGAYARRKARTIAVTRQHLLLLALLLASLAVARAAPAPEGTATVPRFESAPCPAMPIKALANARCGYLVVPEDRSRPEGRSIRLIVAIIPALSARPEPDPVVYLVGGPGGIALGEADLVVAAGFNRDRDLVLMNQRGTYFSEPALSCASIDEFNRELLGLRFYAESTKRAHLAATEACHRALAATGAELSAYNSSESAADFADLRSVLGYAKWNVLGVSYGTYLAQTLMGDHPEGIRSVVLDSTVPLTVTIPEFWLNARAGFDHLFRACAAEAACDAAHPRLEKTFTGLVNKLEVEPLTAMVSDPATSEDVKVVLDGGALVDWLRNQSYSTPLLRDVPDLIGGLAAGQPGAIAAIAKDRDAGAPRPGPGVPSAGYGLGFGVVCREWYPLATQEDLVAAGRQAFPLYPASLQDEAVGTWAYANEDCRDMWKVPAAPATVRQPPASSIPTLLISGSFDAVTSLDWTKTAAASLSNATIVSISGIGHFVSPESQCAQAVIASFLADPDAPDTSCVGALKPPSFTSRASP